MPSITPFLWFDGRAGEAAEFYTSLFGDSAVLGTSHNPEAAPGVPGAVLSVEFELAGQRFTALNGGPQYTFTPAVSFMITCADQSEVDHYWDGLLDGGEPSRCGWLTDRFGLSWQVVPQRLYELMSDPDPDKSQRVVAAMLQMIKLDVAELERAHAGG